jgi:hypothetical protein
MDKYTDITTETRKNNLKKLLKQGLEVVSTTGKKLVLGKGLLRLMYDIDTDEVTSQYILNK